MNTEILHTVYEQENGRIYNEILENEFIYEYLIVEFNVTNAGVVTNTYFDNDLDDLENYEEFADQQIIFRVEELAQDTELKEIIENGRTIPELKTFMKDIK